MKVVHALATGLVVGVSFYLAMTSFHILPSSRSMAYGLLVGSCVVSVMSKVQK